MANLYVGSFRLILAKMQAQNKSEISNLYIGNFRLVISDKLFFNSYQNTRAKEVGNFLLKDRKFLACYIRQIHLF